MKRPTTLIKLVLTLATSGMLLQLTNCNSTVTSLVLNTSNQALQVMVSGLINAMFYSIGQASRIPLTITG